MSVPLTGLFAGWLADDAVIYGNPRTVANTITKGDFVIASGTAVIGAESSLVASSLRASGLGIALANNPVYDHLGNAVVNTALPIATRGIFRVSAMSATNEGHWPVGQPVYPATTASGILSQTGATGMAAIWSTAPVVDEVTGWSGAKAFCSGVGKVIKLVKVGSTGQADIMLFPQGAFGYI